MRKINHKQIRNYTMMELVDKKVEDTWERHGCCRQAHAKFLEMGTAVKTQGATGVGTRWVRRTENSMAVAYERRKWPRLRGGGEKGGCKGGESIRSSHLILGYLVSSKSAFAS